MEAEAVFVGIDVSKRRLDAALGEQGEIVSLSNAEAEITAWQSWAWFVRHPK